MFRKILVALDGSEIARLAFTRAIELAKCFHAEVHVIYVIESGFASPGPVDSSWELIYQRFETEGHNIMQEIKEEGEKAGVTLVPHIETGHAGDMILHTAENIQADLIVVGSLGKSKLDRLLLGSVSTHVVNYGKSNVLIIRK